MSFFRKILWWGDGPIGPEKDFTMVLGEGVDGKKKKKKESRYGTGFERMTSPGRDAMRENTLTQSAKKKPRKERDSKTKQNGYTGQVITEELEVISRNGEIRKEVRERSIEDDIISAKDYQRRQLHKKDTRRNRFEEDKDGSHNKESEEYIDNSYDYEEVFNRMDRQTLEKVKIGADQGVLYWVGPITNYLESPARLPLEDIADPSKVTVVKIACGWDHMIVLLENGWVFVWGNNAQGQLNLDPKAYPKVEGKLLFHPKINKNYEVSDIGCGSNHSVFLVRPKKGGDGSRRILTCGYHGCLGVPNVNEDEYRLQTVEIPDLKDYDRIEYLICKFNSSAVLDDDNNLYYWGDDFDGFRERIPEKKKLFSKRIVDISFGFRHAVALLEDGSVYTWGDGNG